MKMVGKENPDSLFSIEASSEDLRKLLPTFDLFLKLRELQRENLKIEKEVDLLSDQRGRVLKILREDFSKNDKEEAPEEGVDHSSKAELEDKADNGILFRGVCTRRRSSVLGLNLINPIRYFDCVLCTGGYYGEQSLRKHYYAKHQMCFGNLMPESADELMRDYGRKIFCWKFFSSPHVLENRGCSAPPISFESETFSECPHCPQRFLFEVGRDVHSLCCSLEHSC